MESFRTSAKTVRIEVNDNGYCVELNTSSDLWLKSYLDFAQEAQENARKRGEALKGTDDVDAMINSAIGLDEDLKNGFDKLFGEGSYKETFGYDLVGAEYVVEFLEACMPYIEKRVEQRTKALDKYSPNKTGGAR